MSSAFLKKYKGVLETARYTPSHSLFKIGPLSLNRLINTSQGVPSGRLVHIYGKPGSGKTTLAMSAIEQMQRNLGHAALFIDYERSFDNVYATCMGIDLDRLYVARPATSEEGLNIAVGMIKNNLVKMVVMDSIAAAVPAEEAEKDFDDKVKMASSAGIITRACLRLNPLCFDHDVMLVMLNQTRKNFNPMSPETEIPYGATAVQFYASVNLHTQKIETKEEHIVSRATLKKNKVTGRLGKVDYTITRLVGIQYALDVIEEAVKLEVVEKNGGWYTYKGQKLQGKETAAAEFPIEEIQKEIESVDIAKENQ